MTIRVLIVDDSAVVRCALSDLINQANDMEVMAVAKDPFEAAAAMRKEAPDVIMLDTEMPKMDGLTFLQRLMAQYPLPVIICSAEIEKQSPAFLEAIRLGAVDVLAKPKLSKRSMFNESHIIVTDMIRAAAGAYDKRTRNATGAKGFIPRDKNTADVILPAAPFRGVAEREPIVAMGASTGGTKAIEDVFLQLEPTCPAIAVVQHMPELYTAAFAKRLNELCRITIKEAEQGERFRPGVALIAPGDKHLLVQKKGASGYRAEIVSGELVSRHRPSVDVLFRSIAQAAGPSALGVLMTGMGADGAQGLAEMKAVGARTIAQDEESSVVFGMPAEAIRLGCVDKITDLHGIAHAIRTLTPCWEQASA